MSDFQRQAGREVVAVRPLVKGMFRDRSSQLIEEGGFWTVRNGSVTPTGVLRRPAYYEIAAGDSFLDHAVDSKSWIQSSGDVIETLITESTVYDMSKIGGLTRIGLDFTDGSVTDSGDATTINKVSGSDDWQNASDWDEVWPGDYFVLDSDGTAVRIAAVNSDTQIELASAYPTSGFSEASYTIYRGFRVRDTEYLVDTVVANDRMVFLSRYLPPVEMNEDGDALGYLEESGGDSQVNGAYFTAVTGAFFNERLYLGHITEWTGSDFDEYRQRIRFSTATDFGDFDASSNANYIDLDYTRGAIKAIRPLGNLLAVYLEDAIYLGQATPDVNNPLVFDQIETGGVGLVGQKAVVPYLDGHFFVGQDNIYFHSTRGLEAIGTPILTETIRKCEKMWRIYAVNDPKRNRILFGFPESNDFIENVWSFDYRTGAWSYEEYATWMIAAPLFDNNLSWNDLGSYTWDTGTLDSSGTVNNDPSIDTLGAAWDDLSAEGAIEVDLVREYEGTLQIASRGASVDDGAGAIEFRLESKDHDLNRPDLEKTWSRLAVKLQFLDNSAFSQALDFTCEVSQNRGRTWKNVGTLRIRAGMDEGHCDFRLTGSTFRFRLTSTSEVTPYYVTEYTYSVTPLSNESHLGSQEGA